jgi:OmcA/MtrC family decaheme c-type cytochrome
MAAPTVDMPVMTHKIHMGADLPSVQAGMPYQIIGFQQGVNDYSTVHFPADVRRCEVCHEQGPVGTPAAPARQANAYLIRPSRAACGACHDNVNFATGENHIDLPQVSDNQCATCHIPQGELEFDASIKGAHTIPTHSLMLPGVVFEILGVDNGRPGQSPTVSFTIQDKTGNPILPSEMTALRLVNSTGSAYDYPGFVSEDARRATASGNVYSYTFQRAIPADAQGTFAVGIEGYRAITLLPGTRKEMPNVRDAGLNKVFYYAVTDPTAAPRRTVVTQAKCASCHEFLELHGSNRNQVEHCLLCHNANETDTARRPADQQPPADIHFKTMIHKIHTGEELTADYTVYGFGNVPHNYNEVRYPGDRRDCGQCHVNNSEQLPLREGLLPTVAPRDLINPMQPVTAACLSCHTTRPAASHALLNTSVLGEACAVCHGPTSQFSINRVHAR